MARAVRMTRQAISPRLAIRSVRKRRYILLFIASHPEQAELRWLDRRIGCCRQAEPEHQARIGGIDHAVIPQPRGGVIGIALLFVLGADRLAEFLFLFRRPGLALGFDAVAPHLAQYHRGLLAAHHGDPRIRPQPEEARAVSAATHAVI